MMRLKSLLIACAGFMSAQAFAVDPPPEFPVTQVTSPWVTSAAQAGVWSLRLQDGSGNAITSQASGGQRALDVGINVLGIQVDPRARTWTLSGGTDIVKAQLQDNAGSAIVLGQAAAAGSLPVVTQADASPATQAVTTQDLVSATAAGANSQSIITGTPTAGSAATFSLSSWEGIEVQVTGTWTGSLTSEISIDGGTTWYLRGIKQSGASYIANTFTANFSGGLNVSGMTNFRIRATAAMTGTATVKVIQSVNQGSVIVTNPGLLRDGTTQSITNTIKAASTAAQAADTSVVVGLSPNSPVPTGTNTIGAVKLVGDTDATKIGNVSDRLKIDDGGTAVPMINRTDVSTTVSASGNSSALDTNGLAAINYNFSVTAISGSGAYIQFHVQTSDDGTTWATYADTPRLTVTGITRYQSFRQAGRYYRYTWDVAGTTPSVTFNIVTTLKPFQSNRKSIRFFYADLDLTTNGNVSTTFTADDCRNIGVFYIRGADGGNNATVAVQGSLDQVNWTSLTGNLSANPSTSNSQTFVDNAYRFYQFIVIAKTSAGTRTVDFQWSCN